MISNRNNTMEWKHDSCNFPSSGNMIAVISQQQQPNVITTWFLAVRVFDWCINNVISVLCAFILSSGLIPKRVL